MTHLPFMIGNVGRCELRGANTCGSKMTAEMERGDSKAGEERRETPGMKRGDPRGGDGRRETLGVGKGGEAPGRPQR